MKYIYFLILPFLFSSCATVLNTRFTTVQVHTIPTGAKIVVNKTDTFCCSDKELIVERSEAPLRLFIIKDSLTQDVQVPSRTSDNYRYLNAFSPDFLGYLIDLLNDNRFTYPKEVYVDLKKNTTSYSYKFPEEKQEDMPLNIGLSIPIVNGYYYSKDDKNHSLAGMLGLGLHAEYFLNKKYFISTEISELEHNTSGLGVYYYPYISTHHRLVYINARINKRINHWQLGAGLSYQQFNMEKTKYDSLSASIPNTNRRDTSYQIASQYSEGLGLNLSVQYQLGRYTYLGMMFQPLLINTAPSAKGYMHYINFNVIFKLPVWKRK